MRIPLVSHSAQRRPWRYSCPHIRNFHFGVLLCSTMWAPRLCLLVYANPFNYMYRYVYFKLNSKSNHQNNLDRSGLSPTVETNCDAKSSATPKISQGKTRASRRKSSWKPPWDIPHRSVMMMTPTCWRSSSGPLWRTPWPNRRMMDIQSQSSSGPPRRTPWPNGRYGRIMDVQSSRWEGQVDVMGELLVENLTNAC